MTLAARPPAARLAPSGPVLGLLYMAGFCVLGPGIDIFAKLAAQTLPIGVVALARFVTQSVALGLVALLLGRRLPRGRALLPHFARGALIAAATLFFFAALRHMAVADAMAIFFVEPLLLTLLGALLLAEPVGPRRVIACAVGFGGSLLVIQPSFSEIGVPALYPLGTAGCFALYMILTRRLRDAGVVQMQLLAGLSGGAVVGAALWLGEGSGSPHFDPVMPRGAEWALLAGVGLCATLSHLLIVQALRHAPASVAAPAQYLEIVFAALYGWWVFRDFPDSLTWTGIAIVAGSGLYVVHRERAAQRRAAEGPGPVPTPADPS